MKDPGFLGRIEDRIRGKRVNAEWAVQKTAAELDERFAQIDDQYLRGRSEDLTDVSRHILRSLQGIDHHELSEIGEDVVIVADDLTPADAVRLGRERVVGFVMETGGRTSHTAIIARSLHRAAVAGVEGISQLNLDEVPVVVDGERGEVVIHPTPAVLARYRRRRDELDREEETLLATAKLEAVTRDGVAVSLMANIDLPEELAEVRAFGSCGIGLYRSEFLYIEKSPELPSEEEHVELYRRLVEAAAPAAGDHPHLRPRRPEARPRADGDARGQPGPRPARHPLDARAARTSSRPSSGPCCAPPSTATSGCCCRWSARWGRCAASGRSSTR